MPSQAARYCTPAAPTIGPSSVVRPPTITQITTCPAWFRSNICGPDVVAPDGPQYARERRDAAAQHEDAKAVAPDVVAEELHAPRVFADADQRPPKVRREQQPEADIDQDEHAGREIEEGMQLRLELDGQIERGHGRNAVLPVQAHAQNGVLVPRRRADGLLEDQRHDERDDAEIDVADAAVDHEIAEQQREQHGQDDGRDQAARRCLPE